MLKIKKVLCISFSVLLLAFSLLIPFKNIKKDNIITTNASDVQVTLGRGYYLFNLVDENFYFPDFDFTIDNVNISFANPNGQYVTNANKIVYTASNRTLKYQVVDYNKNVLIAEGVVLNNGVWVTAYSIQSRIFILNEHLKINSNVWEFFNKNLIKNYNFNTLLCSINFRLLNLKGIGSSIYFYNSHNEYNKFRFYILDDTLEIGFNVENKSIYAYQWLLNDDLSFNVHNGYVYLSGSFFTNVKDNDFIYSLKLYENYYFYTLSNNTIKNPNNFDNFFYNFEFNCNINNDGQNVTLFGIGVNNNKLYYSNKWDLSTSIDIAYLSDQSSYIDYVYKNYNPLIIQPTSIREKIASEFIFYNFRVATDNDFITIENKNKTFEMLKEDYTMLGMFSSMFDSMLLTFKSLLNFDLFGFNIFSILCALLTISLVFIVFKLLKGR